MIEIPLKLPRNLKIRKIPPKVKKKKKLIEIPPKPKNWPKYPPGNLKIDQNTPKI